MPKTSKILDYPADEGDAGFHKETWEVLSHPPRRGAPLILREIERGESKP